MAEPDPAARSRGATEVLLVAMAIVAVVALAVAALFVGLMIARGTLGDAL